MTVIAQSQRPPSAPQSTVKPLLGKSQISYPSQSPQIISKIQFSKESLILMFFVLLFIVFKMVQSFVEFIATLVIEDPDGRPHHESSRLVAAQQVLKFVTLLVTVGASLGVGLGLFKVFADLANLVLPEKIFGLLIFIGYCGLFSSVRAFLPDIRKAAKKLFSNVPSSDGSQSDQ